ncbi:MAG: purine biosynthesis protein PurH [Lachnospiraceae bacterium]
MGREKYLIANTTRQQREKIVRDALEYSEIGCESCESALGYEMYEPYIEGKMELFEITQQFNRAFVKAGEEMERPSCGMGIRR